jgi:Ca2+-binding EF-hand superfamily protein
MTLDTHKIIISHFQWIDVTQDLCIHEKNLRKVLGLDDAQGLPIWLEVIGRYQTVNFTFDKIKSDQILYKCSNRGIGYPSNVKNIKVVVFI